MRIRKNSSENRKIITYSGYKENIHRKIAKELSAMEMEGLTERTLIIKEARKERTLQEILN